MKLNKTRSKRFINRWNVIRKINDLRNQEFDKYERKQQFNGVWIRFYHLRNVLKNLADKFNIVKDEEIRTIRSDWCIRRITKQLKKVQLTKGQTLDQRNQNTLKFSLSFLHFFHGKSILDPESPHQKLLRYIENTSTCYFLRTKFLACYRQLAKIKACFVNQRA